MIGWACVVALLAQAPSGPPAARSPEAWAIPGHRVHVIASESLNPDSLGALARPGVVLWLETRSNALLPATVERLAGFEESWVQVRSPVLPAHAALLRKAHRAGIWVSGVEQLASTMGQLGVRRVALDHSGAIDESVFTRMQQARPARVQWRAPSVDLSGFGRFLQLPGQKTLVVTTPSPSCDQSPRSRLGEITVEVDSVASAQAMAACGWRVRVRVKPQVEDATLATLFRTVPNAELEVLVGSDERQAMAARRLLERLERASGSVRGDRQPSRRQR